jgi:phospho-N-acetylmuramoyl-pentapeptide-transferase
MGGILIWGSIVLTVAFSRLLSYFGLVENSLLQRGQVYLPLFMLLSLGILGAIDDYLGILGVGKKRGLEILPKILTLILLSSAGAFWFYFKLGYDSIYVPFVGPVPVDGWYVPIFIFLILATTNAVNITDGLDGLAGGLLVIAFGAFSLLAYLNGLSVLAAFCAVCAGAIVAFLWHNVPPALFFMGDTGSLALGGTLGVIALMADQVLLLPFIGFVFVIETLSVIIQLASKKFRGKKIFRAAPLHHHFEALEWGESKVTMRLWIIGSFAAFLGVVFGIFG